MAPNRLSMPVWRMSCSAGASYRAKNEGNRNIYKIGCRHIQNNEEAAGESENEGLFAPC